MNCTSIRRPAPRLSNAIEPGTSFPTYRVIGAFGAVETSKSSEASPRSLPRKLPEYVFPSGPGTFA